MASKFVSDTAAGKSVSAFIILNPKGEHVATIKAHWSNGGICLVNVHDNKAGFQFAKAGGYGYDKFNSALSGLSIDGHIMSDHCSRDGAPKPPKGRKTFPRDYKPRKGYSLADWAFVSKTTGGCFYRDYWMNLACDQLNIARDANLSDYEFGQVYKLADKLKKDWKQSDDCEAGYMDCYRRSGLDYLSALGYRVIQAI